MASLGQFDNTLFKETDKYINSPVPKLGAVNLNPQVQNTEYTESSKPKPRLADSKIDYEAYRDKPWHEDVGAVGKSIGAGFAVELPRTVGQAAQALSPEDSAVSKWGKGVVQSAKDRAKDWEVDMKGRGDVAKAFIEGGKMLAPSLASLPAYLAGPVAGTAATIALYGGSQYQDVYERAKAKGLDDEQAHRAGLLSGAIEGGGEAIANRFSLGLLGAGRKVAGKTIEEGIKGATEAAVLKPFAKSFAAAIPGEVATETLQQYGESQVEGAYGIGKAQGIGESFKEVAGPTTAMTILLSPLGLAGHYSNAKRVEGINKVLDDPQAATPEERGRVVDMLADHATKLDIPKGEVDSWRAEALKSIANNEPVNRFADYVPSKADAIQPEEGTLPGGKKIVNKDIEKVYSQFNNIFEQTENPLDETYQNNYTAVVSSLNSIINPGEGKVVDPAKAQEAKDTLKVVEAAHRTFVNDFNKEAEAAKAKEDIASSSDSSAKKATEEAVKEEEVVSKTTDAIDEEVDNIVTAEDLVEAPIDEEVVSEPKVVSKTAKKADSILSSLDNDVTGVSKAVEAPTETKVEEPIQPVGVEELTPDLSKGKYFESYRKDAKAAVDEKYPEASEELKDKLSSAYASLKSFQDAGLDSESDFIQDSLRTIKSTLSQLESKPSSKQDQVTKETKVEEPIQPVGEEEFVPEMQKAKVFQDHLVEAQGSIEAKYPEGPKDLKDKLGNAVASLRFFQDNGLDHESKFVQDSLRTIQETLSQLEGKPNKVEESSGIIKPIIKNRDLDVKATEESLPAVKGGFTRVYRASSPTVSFEDVFNKEGLEAFKTDKEGDFYTSDLSYADYFRETYGKDAVLEYRDIPTSEVEGYRVSPAEFVIPKKEKPNAKQDQGPTETNVSSSTQPGIREESRVEDVSSEGLRSSGQETRVPTKPKKEKEVSKPKTTKVAKPKASTKPKAQTTLHPKETKLIINITGGKKVPGVLQGKKDLVGTVKSISQVGNKIKYTVTVNHIASTGASVPYDIEVYPKDITGVVGESLSLSDTIKQESTSNKEVINSSVLETEMVNEGEVPTEDTKEISQEEVKPISPQTKATIDELDNLRDDLLDELDITEDRSERAELKAKIKEVENKLEELGYRLRKSKVKVSFSEGLDELSEGEEDYLPDYGVDELNLREGDDDYRFNFSSESSNVADKIKETIATNHEVMEELIKAIDKSYVKIVGDGKVTYKTKLVEFTIIDDFLNFDPQRFMDEFDMDQRGAMNMKRAAGVVLRRPKSVKILMNARNRTEDFIGTFFHETVGHFGVRRLMQAHGNKYENFLLHLINSNQDIRKDIFDKYETWYFYLNDMIRKELKIPNNQELTQAHRDIFFMDRQEGVDYVRADVKYKKGTTSVRIPIEIAKKLADEYIAETAKELMNDKTFIDNQLGLGMNLSPTRIYKRLALRKKFNGLLNRIKHMLRSVFGKYMDHLTIDDVNNAVALSADSIFQNTDLSHIFNRQAKTANNVNKRPILKLNKQAVVSTNGQIVPVEYSVDVISDNETLNDDQLPEDLVEEVDTKARRLVEDTAKFKALQSFGNLNNYFAQKHWNKLQESMKNSPLNFLTTFKNMSNQELYRAIQSTLLGDVARTEDKVKGADKFFKTLIASQRKSAYKFFVTPEYQLDPELFTPDQISQLEDFKKTIEDLGQRFVELGVLDKDVYEKNKGAYLHTVYYDFIREYKGTGKKTSVLSQLKRKKNLNEKEKFALGEIKDVRYLVPETLGVMMRDAAILTMFQTVSDSSVKGKTYWVLHKDVKVSLPWNKKKKVSLDKAYDFIEKLESMISGIENTVYLKEIFDRTDVEFQRLKEQHKELIASVESIETSMIDEAFKHAETTGDKGQFVKDNYIRMPFDRRWGALKGKLVRKEIYSDLDVFTSAYTLAEGDQIAKFFANGGILDRINRFWKKSMVMYNPGSWGRNILGNFSLLDLSTPTNSIKLARMLHEEITRFRKKDNSVYWNIAKNHGLFGTSYSAVEINDIFSKYADQLDEVLATSRKRPESKWDVHLPFLDESIMSYMEIGKDLATDKYHRFDNTLSKYYSLIEGAFKTVALRDYIERFEKQEGKKYTDFSEDEQEMIFLKATNHANEAIFNYSEVNSIVRVLRRVPLGSPFLTFTYKSAPLMVKSMMTNPIKFAKYATLPAMVTMIAQAAFDWDDDDIKKLHSRLPEYYRNNPGVAFLPFKDKEGRPQILPLDYLVPWNQIWSAASKAQAEYMKTEGEGFIGPMASSTHAFIDEFGFLGGPVPQMITAYRAGVDDFTGKPIVTPGASPNTQLMERMMYAGNIFLPAFLANGGYFSKLYKAIVKEEKNDFGELRMTPLQAVSDITGFRARSVLERQGVVSRQKEFQSRLRDISSLRNKIVRDRNISSTEKASKMKEIATREKMVREQMRKAIQGIE